MNGSVLPIFAITTLVIALSSLFTHLFMDHTVTEAHWAAAEESCAEHGGVSQTTVENYNLRRDSPLSPFTIIADCKNGFAVTRTVKETSK